MSSKDIQKDEESIYKELYPEINWASPELAVYQHIPAYDGPPLSDITLDEHSQWEQPKKEILIKYYQKIIDKHLQFTHVITIK
jgi:hypothetical protein